MDPKYNLDEGVQEFFEFVVKGHKYRFTHLTTEQMIESKKIENDEDKAREFLYNFITKVDPASPEFSEVAKQMTPPHWRKFRDMIKAEMGEQN